VPETALCRALAEVFTWATAGATAAAAVSGGWPLADVIAAPRLDTEFCSAVVCDGYADLASLAKPLALVWTLLSALCREPRPFAATSTLPRLLTEVFSVGAVGGLAAAASRGQPAQNQDQDGGRKQQPSARAWPICDSHASSRCPASRPRAR